MVKAQDTRSELAELQDMYSDTFKDFHGFRPRGLISVENWNSLEYMRGAWISFRDEHFDLKVENGREIYIPKIKYSEEW